MRIDGGLWEEWEAEDPGQPQPDAQANRPALQVPRQQGEGDQAAPPPADIADDRAQQAQDQANPPQQQQVPPALQGQQQQQAQQAANGNGERRLSFSPTAIAETVLGAILFPTIAGMSGELLKLILPRAWTTPAGVLAGSASLGARGRVPAKGLLQEKWGRSLVGGCLFVVAKDAVMLYVRWKMAQMHRRRRVLDYEKSKRGVRA